MNILLDVDGILADFTGATLTYLQQQHGLSFHVSQVTQHDIIAPLRLPDDVARETRAFWRSPRFCSSLPTYPNALSFVDGLRHLGTVVAVTAPMPKSLTWAEERRQWLEAHFGIKSVVSTNEKHHVHGDVLIEDSADNLIGHPAPCRVLLRRPWNEADLGAAKAAGCQVAEDYYEVLQILNAFRNARGAA